MTFKKLLMEPLLHFFLVGGVLFALYGWLNENEAGDVGEIVITTAMLEQIEATFERTWQRPPTEQEMEALIDGWGREEILYRQGVALGFDQGDPAIRRRVAQKMTFVADGLAPEAPTDDELNTWLEANADDYYLPPRYTFEQIYISPGKPADELAAYLAEIETALQDKADPEALGDQIMLPGEVTASAPRDIERTFGLEFAASLADLEVGSWQGPVASGYGLHFVRLNAVIPGRAPSLDEVRPEVERDFLDEQASEISESFYQVLRERYTVRVEPQETGP